jgi:2-polyprenyl-3-methyl-5-hydroxy-6-metoxy-1,4-benzoquinol methylase
MTDRSPRRRQWAWHLSALGYRWSYLRVAHVVDEDLFAHLADRLRGARVVDCGCGPGILSEKLAGSGTDHVLAVDANPSMARQASVRLSARVDDGTATVLRAFVDAEFFGTLGGRVDVVIFKRSLYASRAASVATVRAAFAALAPGGVLVVVHPERSVRRYAFGAPPRWRRHTAFHLVNRAISLLAVGLGISEYRTHTTAELVRLLAEAAPAGRVETVPTTQEAFSIVAVWSVRPGEWSLEDAIAPVHAGAESLRERGHVDVARADQRQVAAFVPLGDEAADEFVAEQRSQTATPVLRQHAEQFDARGAKAAHIVQQPNAPPHRQVAPSSAESLVELGHGDGEADGFTGQLHQDREIRIQDDPH